MKDRQAVFKVFKLFVGKLGRAVSQIWSPIQEIKTKPTDQNEIFRDLVGSFVFLKTRIPPGGIFPRLKMA